MTFHLSQRIRRYALDQSSTIRSSSTEVLRGWMDYQILREAEQPWPISAQCLTGIWVSSKVQLAENDVGELCVWHWTIYDEVASNNPELAPHFSGRIPNRSYIDRETGDRGSTGPDHWDWKRKTIREDKLTEKFLKLSQTDDPKRVLRFATQYGPLWICRKHLYCFWNEFQFEYLTNPEPMSSPDSLCEWDRKEPISEYQKQAKIALAAFDVWQKLRAGKRAPLQLWQTIWDSEGALGEHATLVSRLGLAKQQEWLAHIVTRRIHRRVNLNMNWGTGPTPQLVLNTGLGFFPVVWRALAQRIAGGLALYNCSGCQTLYFRKDHKPPEGRNNFCSDCKSDAAKLAKRLWAQKSRREKRNAEAQG